ncbi:hypothetical protein IFM12275_34060 [Nocardia sputorum]|nr:hypothetical protein IFM12275_34060 [Nocardia sputorum]
MVLGRIALAAFADIQSQPNWMQSDETFLEVLLRVSDPAYKPGEKKAPAKADSISTNEMSPLAYLPQKVLNEIVGLIVTNQNTIPVILSDPYNLTLGPNHTGHHFDYWDDADPAAGKPLTSAEYAAAWLTHLAKQAQAGKQVDPTSKPQEADLAAVYKAVETTSATPTTEPAKTSTTSATPTGAAPTTTGSTSSPTTTVAPTTTTTTAPAATTPAPSPVAAQVETTKPTTTEPTTTTTQSAAPATSTTAKASN